MTLEAPVLLFSRIDVTDPRAVALFMYWLWWGELPPDPDEPFDLEDLKSKEDARLKANPALMIEEIWDIQAPRKRMAKLLWLHLQGTTNPRDFEQRFTSSYSTMLVDARNCATTLQPIQARLAEVIETYLQRTDADRGIGQGAWGEEWWLAPDQAEYVRAQLHRARPTLLERQSDFEEALGWRIRALKRLIGLAPISLEAPDRSYRGTRPDGVKVYVEHAGQRELLPNVEDLGVGGAGFEWGYAGGGPNALAASIVADATGGLMRPDFLEDFIADFRDAFLVDRERYADLIITRSEVLSWLALNGCTSERIEAEYTAAKERQRLFGPQLEDLLTTAHRIRALPEGHLRAQRFDLVPDDFECALYLDLMEWLQRGGYAIRCSLCNQPISCDGSALSNRLKGRWMSGRPVYHEGCAQTAERNRKAKAWRKRAQDPDFREAERTRVRESRRFK